MADYEVGQETYYLKDGVVFRVKVLENNSDERWQAYRLRIDEIIEGDFPLAGITKVGKEFECIKLRKSCAGGLWRLTENLPGKGRIEYTST